MKTSSRISLAIAVASLALVGVASAQISAYDDASQAAYGSGWNAGVNGGYGFGPWTLTNNSGNPDGFAGTFIGASGVGAVDTSGSSFGMYANGGTYNYSVAYRSLSNSLTTGVVLKFKMKNNSIASSTDYIGFSLFSGSTIADPSTLTSLGGNSRFSFYFQGGGSYYLIWDGSSVNPTTVGWNGGGLTFLFSLTSADTYNLVVKNADETAILYTTSGVLLSTGTIDSIACYNFNSGSGGDLFFNQFMVASSAMFAPRITSVLPANDAIYVATNATVSFNAISDFSAIDTNSISLSLNGAAVTGLSFTGASNNWAVTASPTLVANRLYTGTIVATDVNGASTTNTFNFNTWSSENPFIEAEDYNFNAGSYGPGLFPDAYAGFATVAAASNNVDCMDYNTTLGFNVYRTNDFPEVEVSFDVDHAGYSGFAANYNLGFIKRYEWENYTRNFTPAYTNTSYVVYARMAGIAGSPTMLLERLASPTATTTTQPRTPVGTFVGPITGGTQTYAFVPLKDIFSNPVELRLAGVNTLRTTSLSDDGSYNFDYLVFVPSTNAAILRPYISSGFPYPGAGPVMPDQGISFTVANRQTSVSGIRLFVNSVEVTGSLVLDANAAGTTVNYTSPALLPGGVNTLETIISDGTVSLTNQWQFTVATLPVIPSGYAVPPANAGAPGFAVQIAKAFNAAPPADFPTTISRALAHLAGTIIYAGTGTPYVNQADGGTGGQVVETNAINYDINATASGNSTFNYKSAFPNVPASSTNNFISMSADGYVYLTAGLHTFAVRSDDGFMVAAGPTLGSTNLVLGLFDGGRGDATPTVFSFIVQTTGLYPLRLIYDQGEFGGSVEFYSISGNGNILVNDPNNVNAVKVYRTVSSQPAQEPLASSRVGNDLVLSWSNPAFSLAWSTNVVGPYTNRITGATSPYTITNMPGTPSAFFRLVWP